ncbi:MAG TPA: hypothetical protein VJT83_08335, partial [Chitinophagaceae bacterium]|nr:hypothetical protein [Chitinophagaceae bacterium]
MKRIFLFSLLLIPFLASSQDLTGVWRGNFKSNNSSVIEKIYGIEDRYKFEVQIDQRNQSFQGVTYSYKTTVFYGKASAKGTVNTKTKKVLLEEIKIVEVRMSDGSDACIMTLFLNYSKNGGEEFMEGTYTSMNTRDSSSCGRGTVFLRKVPTSDFYKEPFLVKREEEALKKKNAPPVIAKKTTPPATKPPATNSNTTKTQQKKTPPPVVKKQTSPKTQPKDIVRTNPAKTVIVTP